jgi:hypothetical protein
MNYLKIVLDGYCNENSRNHLVDYFKREALNAQKENYSFDEFFDGCNVIINSLTQYYKDWLDKEQKSNLLDMELNKQKGDNEAYEFYENLYKNITLYDVGRPLFEMGYSGHLYYNEIQLILYAITRAKNYFKLQENNEKIKNIIQEATIKATQKAVQPQPDNHFLNTTVERTRLIEIHTYLSKKYIDVDVDSWLYWFSKQTWTNKKEKPKRIKWIGAVYHLTNVVYLICGNMNIQTETAMKEAFELPKGTKFQQMTIVKEPKTEKQHKKNNNQLYTDLKKMIVWAERYAIK